MNKRGQIWISAALYTAIGIILIGLILSVGMPFINKVKMRNTLLQTKEVLYDTDKIVREVWNEGLGSRRPLLIEIQEGDFLIYENDFGTDENTIVWKVISDDKLGIEPLGHENPIVEGNLKISSFELGQGYEIILKLDYNNYLNLKTTGGTKQLSGVNNLVIEHSRGEVNCGDDVDCVLIRAA